MTPDGEMDMLKSGLTGSLGGTNRPSSAAGHEKKDYFGFGSDGRSSLSSANGGSIKNMDSAFGIPESSLLQAAAQIASMGNSSGFGDFSNSSDLGGFSGLIGQRFNAPPISSSVYNNMPTLSQQQQQPPTRLNPNAPNFMQFQQQQDFMNRTPGMRGQANKSNGFGQFMNVSTSSRMSMAPNSSFSQQQGSQQQPPQNFSGYGNILNNQSLNSLMSQQFGNSNIMDLGEANMFAGKTVKELTDMLGGAEVPNFAPPPTNNPNVSCPPPGQQQFMNSPPMMGGSDLSEPKFSRPIGSERHRTSQPPPPIVNKPNISNSPWDITGLYPDGGPGGDMANGLPTFPPSLSGQTLDSLIKNNQDFNNGMPSNPGMEPHGPPTNYHLSGMSSPMHGLSSTSSNVTPNKDYPDYMGGSGSAPGSSGKKQPIAGGFMDRGDPTAIRKNMNAMWNKKWEG